MDEKLDTRLAFKLLVEGAGTRGKDCMREYEDDRPNRFALDHGLVGFGGNGFIRCRGPRSFIKSYNLAIGGNVCTFFESLISLGWPEWNVEIWVDKEAS